MGKLKDACISGDLEAVKKLLKENPQDVNNPFENALIYAAWRGHQAVVKYLLTSQDLKEHANIHYVTNNHTNALMYACQGGHLEVIKYLLASEELKEHININDRTKDDKDVLVYANEPAYEKDCWKISYYLIMECDFKIKQTTLDWLKKNEKEDVLKMIEKRELYYKMNQDIVNKEIVSKKRKI